MSVHITIDNELHVDTNLLRQTGVLVGAWNLSTDVVNYGDLCYYFI